MDISKATNGFEHPPELIDLMRKTKKANEELIDQIAIEADKLKFDFWDVTKKRAEEIKKIYTETGLSNDPKVIMSATFLVYSPITRTRTVKGVDYVSLYWGQAKYGRSSEGGKKRRMVQHIRMSTKPNQKEAGSYNIDTFKFSDINGWQKEYVAAFELRMRDLRNILKWTAQNINGLARALKDEETVDILNDHLSGDIENHHSETAEFLELRDRINNSEEIPKHLIELLRKATPEQLIEHDIDPIIKQAY